MLPASTRRAPASHYRGGASFACWQEFRDVSLSQTLVAFGMEAPPPPPPAASQPAAAASGEERQRAILQATFASLACGVRAPALAPPAAWHVCILTGDSGLPACRALKGALEAAWGAKVAPLDAAGAAGAACSAACVLLFLTLGTLAAGSPQLAAAAAALKRGARFVLVHETSAQRGGSAAFNDFYAEASAAQKAGTHDVMAVFNKVTSIPWYDDAGILPVRARPRSPGPIHACHHAPHSACISSLQQRRPLESLDPEP